MSPAYHTLSPGLNNDTFSPTDLTTPVASQPITLYSPSAAGIAWRILKSTGLTDTALTSTKISWPCAVGVSSSMSCNDNSFSIGKLF